MEEMMRSMMEECMVNGSEEDHSETEFEEKVLLMREEEEAENEEEIPV